MTTTPSTSPKRFIAGAVCPRCAVMDKLRCWRDEEREYRECVDCGYADSMRLDGAPEPAELQTRVNQGGTKVTRSKAQAQVVELIPSTTLKDDS